MEVEMADVSEDAPEPRNHNLNKTMQHVKMPNVVSETNIDRAAVHIEDAIRGRVTQTESVALYWFFHGRPWQIIYFLTAIVHNG